MVHGLSTKRTLVALISPDKFQDGKLSFGAREQGQYGLGIRNIGSRNFEVEQQALGIDQNVPFFAVNQFAAVEPVRVDADPPFSALFTLWLSMMQAVGLASRSAFSRHLTYNA